MRYNILVLGFPFYLIFFEILFRTFSQVDTSAFIGPTIGASGLSLLIPLVKPKEIEASLEDIESAKEKGLSVKYERDDKLITIVWTSILFGILLWYWSCATSIESPKEMVWLFPKHFIIGTSNYVIGVALTIWKEVV